MRTIPLEPQKSQSVSVDLSGQRCVIRLIQRESFIYMDLTVNGNPIMQGVPCLYGNKMVRYSYLGFQGDLVFLDNVGQSDPSYDGLGGRFILYYIEESELVQ
ncbi:phage baseplate plug family protein [Enterobacter roggenkampii]|uniref:phage baseplate plug family protein n=1 Tax=Enterobacter roggenkampii TaxID=1812935 RepID=UPI001F3EB84D